MTNAIMQAALERAANLAATLPDPPPGPASVKLRSELMIWLVAGAVWSVLVMAMVIESREPVFLPFGLVGVGMVAWQVRRQYLATTGPLDRDAVVVLDRRMERAGKSSHRHIVVLANRADERREIEVLVEPGLLQKGDVGVAFTRRNTLWHFERVSDDLGG